MDIQKSNKQLQFAVREVLEHEPSIDSNAIGITVDHGLVFLSGHVLGVSQRRATEEAALRIDGVRAVIDELKVRPGRWGAHDADLACVATDALRQLVGLPDGRFKVVIRDGKVRLKGAVCNSDEKTVIGATVQNAICGGGFLDNAISIEPESSSFWDRDRAAVTVSAMTPVRPESPLENSWPETNSMIVVDESFTHEGIPMRFVHHREFPEIRCEGETTTQGLTRLIHQLDQAREYAREPWQKDSIEHALHDARSYHDSLASKSTASSSSNDPEGQIIQFARPQLDVANH
jgi:osmotically-inducible protein OsmY